MMPVADSTSPQKYLVFRIDGIEYALAMTAIREVVMPSNLETYKPGRPGPTHYRVKARGAEIPVVYFGRPKRLGPRNRVVLLDEVTAGLLVDSVSRIEEVPAERHAKGKVWLGGKWRNIFEAVRLVNWALEHVKAG